MPHQPRPVIILPDTTPLIHLAAGGALDVLTAMGRVIVPDVVAMEATGRPDKPFAPEIASWLAKAAEGGPDAPLRIVETDIGDLYRLAVETRRRTPRHAGELSIIEWLRDNLVGQGGRTLVVYEDNRFPRMAASEDLIGEVALLTTRYFLDLAAAEGIIVSGEAVWSRVLAARPTARPASLNQTFRPKP